MPVRLLLPLALLNSSSLAAKPSPAPSALPAALEEFLGPPPTRFDLHFRRPAKDLRAASMLIANKKFDQAAAKLLSVVNTDLGEHALFELANLYRDKKDFPKSSAQGEKLLNNYPGSIYTERVRDLLDANECSQGLLSKKEEAIRLLRRCLWRSSWKAWPEMNSEINALYDHLKGTKDSLFEPFVAELIQAMPASSAIRQRMVKDLTAEKLSELSSLARFRSKNANPVGVKAVYPDLELFDSAIKLVLKEDWKEANALLKRFPSEFPQSEHWDRAQYWLARTEEKIGNKQEAKKRFEQILQETPFTYYGLQAALYLKHEWNLKTPEASNLTAQPRWKGALTTRQALSLWRLRALLSEGLVDYAREEAKFLASARANGAGVGQEDPRGALLLASLFHEAGNHMAAFSHAYAALSLDPELVDQGSLLLIFPFPFKNDFLNAAERTGVNALLLISVAKQESAFMPNAISRADALGLMQLLPMTAKEVLPELDRKELFSPARNTEAGALYLYKLLDRFQGNIALALAAYNAGPTRAAQWQRDLMESPLMKTGFDTDAFIDSIPFSETRKYVGNILRNYAWYKLLAQESNTGSVQELIYQWQKVPKKAEPEEKLNAI